MKLLTLIVTVALVAGCGSSGGSAPTSSGALASGGSGGPSTSAPGASSASAGIPSIPATPSLVRLALDWTPNTNHTGFFVARANGWYRDAAVDLRILPYASATPEALLAAGQADCGISFQDSMTFAVAAGADIVSVAAILQRTASAIGVLADGPIQRPRDLDGRTYAGFGYPNEAPTLKSVIRSDGGTGEFTVAMLDAAAYEALYNRRADFTIPFTAWEGVEAEQRGVKLRYFQFADYGFPEFYQVVLACDRGWLAREPDAARRFVAATARGFELAASDPAEGARLLIAENPGVFDANLELPERSQELLADGDYLLDASGRFGRQTVDRWTAYSSFLYEQGLLVDAAGKPLTQPLEYGRLFTNDLLP